MENVDYIREQVAAAYGVPAKLLTADNEEAIRGQAQAVQDFLKERGGNVTGGAVCGVHAGYVVMCWRAWSRRKLTHSR